MEKHLKLSDVHVGPRFREDYGDVPKLANKIRATKGLKFHFIVVEELTTEENAPEYHLRAGGRRLQAYELLSSGDKTAWQEHEPTEEEKKLYSYIPCTVLKNLTPANRLQIEFIENMGRKEFTWQEAAELVARFHQSMVETYGKATSGPGKTGWSVRDSADDLGLNPSEIVDYLKLASGLNEFSKLKDIKQKSKALTKLKRQKDVQIADLLSIEDYTSADIQIICADSRNFLPTLKDGSVDLIITDPPWGIEFEERVATARTDVYTSYDKAVDPMEIIEVLTLAYQKLRLNCPIYMFYSAIPEKVLEGVEFLKMAGFLVEIIPLIWYKKHILAHDARETRHMLNYEIILYGWKGERPFLNNPSRNVLEHQVAYAGRIHAAEKSQALLIELIELHTQQGELILDPFGGSCVIGDACKISLRKCIVIERDAELVKLASLRIQGI